MNNHSDIIRSIFEWSILTIEVMGVGIIMMGIIVSIYNFIRSFILREAVNFTRLRIILTNYLSLALEFYIGADIISTTMSPDWNTIGELSAIIALRTIVNYFLIRENEMRGEDTE